jgi:hypothetical protein
MHKLLLNSLVLILLNVAMVFGQGALSLSRVTEESPEITGTCINGVTVKISLVRGTAEMPLPDAPCTSGEFRVSTRFLKIQASDIIRIEQTSGTMISRVSQTVPAPTLASPSISRLIEGDSQIKGTCSDNSDVTASVSAAGTESTLTAVKCGGGVYIISMGSVQLREKDTVSVLQVLEGNRSKPLTVSVGPYVSKGHGDERPDFEASAYLGFAVDTFAAEEIQRYLNPKVNGKPTERAIFGFDFGYRLLKSKKDKPAFWPFQLWVYGETVHGVRSDDVDCGKNPDFPTCLDAKADFLALGKAIPSNALYMLRNATSLEGFTGIRIESKPINDGRNPAVLYAKVQAGFLNVAGSDGDAKDMHHFAFGALAVGGRLAGSYLEVGHGRTDLFATNRYKRFKIDGHLQYRIPGFRDGVSFFAQLLADVDAGKGADAMQSYFGLSFDLDHLFKAAPPKP